MGIEHPVNEQPNNEWINVPRDPSVPSNQSGFYFHDK